MIKVFMPSSTGLEDRYLALLDMSKVTNLKVTDKLNGHSDIEFDYPVVKTTVKGVVVANKTLICGTFKCSETRDNFNANESQYLEKTAILNVDNSLFIIYDATVSGNTLKVKGSDYMDIDALQKILNENIAAVTSIKNNVTTIQEAVSKDKATIANAISNAQTTMTNQINDAKTTLTNQINANKTDYNAAMSKIRTDNETYIRNNGVTAVFA